MLEQVGIRLGLLVRGETVLGGCCGVAVGTVMGSRGREHVNDSHFRRRLAGKTGCGQAACSATYDIVSWSGAWELPGSKNAAVRSGLRSPSNVDHAGTSAPFTLLRNGSITAALKLPYTPPCLLTHHLYIALCHRAMSTSLPTL